MVLANVMGPDLIIVLVLVLVLLFGSSQLPKLAKNIGGARKEFHEGRQETPVKPVQTVTPVPSDDDAKVTMTKADLDALLAEREARGRGDQGLR